MALSPFIRYTDSVANWCTVTVSDGEGKRYSLDIQADSSFDAAHLYLTHVKANPACGFPIPTTETLFEVVIDGRVHRVQGLRLKGWIEKKRHEFRGPQRLPLQSTSDDRLLISLQVVARCAPFRRA